ncbi:MAG: helix-turn-helix domain-containing protein [Deltaproteobacteria bacterium]|nr:helix-turn-helix domain-containing protein [Deltaproteobacteria bacterium]
MGVSFSPGIFWQTFPLRVPPVIGQENVLRLNDSLSLLTPREVAELLKISVNTVYRHRHRFGPIYPGGLKCLRFREDIVRAAVENQVGMALADAGAGEKIFRPCQDQGGGPGRHGKEAGRVDPELVARAQRMGLLKSGDGIPGAGPKKVRS